MTSRHQMVSTAGNGHRDTECGERVGYTLTNYLDRTETLVIGVICVVGVALVCAIQFVYSPSITAHIFVSLPPVILACLLPFWLLKRSLAKIRVNSKARTGRNHVTRD